MRLIVLPWLAILAFSLSLASIDARAEPAATTLEPSGLATDAAVLRQAYETLHPGLYRYNSPAQMNARFARLDASLARDRDLRSAYLDISRFTASIKCGHSYPNFFNQPDDVASQLFQHQDRVPFYFMWIGKRMIVTRNFSSDTGLVPGTEIASIDGVPAQQILAALLPLVRADGSNDAKRIDELSVRGDDTYEAFDVYFPMVYPRNSTTIKLRVRSIDGRERESNVEALTYQQRIAPIAAVLAAKHGGTEPLWSFRLIDARTAHLRMPTWDVYDSKWDWKHFLDDVFARLDRDKPARLIVDLRGNEGGSDVGSMLLAHLIGDPIQLDAYQRLVRYRTVPAALRPYLSTWDASFFDWGASAQPLDSRYYRLTGAADDPTVVQPAAPHYRGKFFVLVDAANSSATFNFERIVQERRLGTLIGTPTGGNMRGIDGGAFFFIKLPNSHIEVDLPLIGTFPAQSRPDAGLVPDVAVDTTQRDVAAGTDAQLAAALARF